MEPEPNSDNEKKKDSLPDSKTTKSMKKKAKGKRPVDDVAQITKMTKQIDLDPEEPKTDNAAKSKASGSDSKRNKGKQIENVVKSSYSLRSGAKDMDLDVKSGYSLSSGPKDMDLDVKSSYSLRSGPKEMDLDVKLSGKKRKGKAISRFVLGTPGSCKTTGKRRHSDDDEKDDKDGSGSRVTRSTSKKTKVNSV